MSALPETDALIIQQPSGAPQQLILLFHGMGSKPHAMQALGERLASEFPHALVVAPRAPTPSPNHKGFQWFAFDGVTDDNRADRVAAALPGFEACLSHWQRLAGVEASATALVGFSQGAIMSLESCKRASPFAGRVVAIGGRYATLPANELVEVTVHLLHGKQDTVVPYSNTVVAAHHLRDLGCDVTAEVLPFVGHEIHPDFIDLTVKRLTTHIPNRVWAKAMAADPKQADHSPGQIAP